MLFSLCAKPSSSNHAIKRLELVLYWLEALVETIQFTPQPQQERDYSTSLVCLNSFTILKLAFILVKSPICPLSGSSLKHSLSLGSVVQNA